MELTFDLLKLVIYGALSVLIFSLIYLTWKIIGIFHKANKIIKFILTITDITLLWSFIKNKFLKK